MRLSNFLPLLLFLLPQILSAQKKFEPGYIVSAKKDTLRGYIDYRNWSVNPKEITFKPTLESAPRTYRLAEISAFSVHQEQYEKAEVSVDVSPYKSNQLSASPVPLIQNDTVLLMVMMKGPKSLYYLKDQHDKVHLYIQKNDQFELLGYYQYKLSRDDQSGIITLDRFKQQLRDYLSDCPAVGAKIAAMTYSQKRIGDLFDTYYAECDQSKPTYALAKERVAVHTGLVAGLAIANLRFEGTNVPYLVKADFPLSRQMAGGIFLNLLFPRTQQKLSLYNELLFTSMKVGNHSEEYNSEQDNSSSDVALSYGYLKLNNMVRYHFPTTSFRLFVNGGLSNGLVVSETNTRREEKYFYSKQPTITQQKAIEEIRKHEQGLLLGVGGSIKKYGLEVRYEMSNGMSAYSNVKSPVRRYYFLLSYRL